MKVYSYHPELKYYIGETDADESPLEPGVFLHPANTTTVAPPDPQYKKVHVFNGSGWDTVNDHRGVYYSFEFGVKTEHNNPISPPENSTKVKPPEINIFKQKLVWNSETESWGIENAPELSPEEKLASAGLSVDELKGLLGLV